MAISKALILGLVGALAVGALEVVGENMVQDAIPGSGPEPHTLSVPSGHVGDRLSYVRFTRASEDVAWARASDVDYQVTSLGKQADRTGMVHDAVFITSNATGGGSGGLLGIETAESSTGYASMAVDLGTGDELGFRWDQTVSQQSFFAMQTQDSTSDHAYGPLEADAAVFGPGIYQKFRLTSHQNRTYTLGDERPDVAQELMVPEADWIHRAWGAVEMQGLTVSSKVAERGQVAGREAFAIKSEGCVGFEVSDPRFVYWSPGAPGEIELFGISFPVSSHVCFTVQEWLSGELPYPLLTEVELLIDGTTTLASVTGLAAFDAGGVPIPWGQDSAPQHYQTTNPDAEWSPATQRHPADGTGTAFTFPLSAALQAVAQDPSLLQYSLWRAQHPAAFLIGSSMGPSGEQGEGRVWSLVFAVPGGDAYVIQTEQATPGAPTRQREMGALSVGGFDSERAAAAPITFATVERMWQGFLASPENERTPNYAFWGFLYRAPAFICRSIDADRCGIYEHGFYGNRPFETVMLARSAFEPGAEVGPQQFFSSLFLADAFDGALSGHREVARAVHWEPLAVSAAYEPPEPRAVEGVPAAVHVDVGHAAIASMSFLAVVLLAYFFPTLKFMGTKALFFVPGFSRIQKSEVLENKVRDTLVTAIREDPGVSAPRLQTLTGAAWSTVVYHLGVLERNKLVSSLVDGRHKRFFPVETHSWTDRTRIALLKNARTKGLYEAILGEPGVGFRDLANGLGISRPALYWHVERLTKAGLVGQDRDGNRVRFYANELRVADRGAGTEVS